MQLRKGPIVPRPARSPVAHVPGLFSFWKRARHSAIWSSRTFAPQAVVARRDHRRLRTRPAISSPSPLRRQSPEGRKATSSGTSRTGIEAPLSARWVVNQAPSTRVPGASPVDGWGNRPGPPILGSKNPGLVLRRGQTGGSGRQVIPRPCHLPDPQWGSLAKDTPVDNSLHPLLKGKRCADTLLDSEHLLVLWSA